MTKSKIDRYTVAEEPTGDVYVALLKLASERCDAGLFVIRDQRELTLETQQVLKNIRHSIISDKQQSRWPGTELIGHTARVVQFAYSDLVCDVLTKATNHLYGWIEPTLPEDLCLIRPDGRPWLVSISHEGDAYLDIDSEEHRGLTMRVPIELIREDHQSCPN